ncbi:MAG: hypothetical protein IJ299_01415, partial [Oscillospiraceae bacterium]|nr:hypothetical protein [Oscillospiraceae bacterium]
MAKRSGRVVNKKKKSGFMYFRLFLCFLIICSAVVLKYTNAPVIEKIAETVSRELIIDEAVDAISRASEIVDGIAEVFRNEKETDTEKNDAESVFSEDYYIEEGVKEFKKEIEENRKKAEVEAKQLSVETLSFQMSAEELSDDTKAEPFRIPPPS